ncbi:hypothetical protein BLFGPEAP_01034 [Candidatus Methanoperedenaceae archaeon GB50]|nr:hypothetical protein BLFGPEAP_01034 [Candidatus Methanoperedenaceae archaeon GB50]
MLEAFIYAGFLSAPARRQAGTGRAVFLLEKCHITCNMVLNQNSSFLLRIGPISYQYRQEGKQAELCVWSAGIQLWPAGQGQAMRCVEHS